MKITIENINKSYKLKSEKEIQVLKDINLSIQDKEFIALMGPSGAGKSTLLHIIGSIDYPDSGKVFYELNNSEKIDIANLKNDKISEFRNTNIGFVFQQYHLLPEFTALENVYIPSLINGKGISKSKEIAYELLEKTGIKDRANHKPAELSGGESQRVAIARALINKPAILLADEPTGNLDFENSEMILEILKDVKKYDDLTLIIATHSKTVAERADKVIQIVDGRVL